MEIKINKKEEHEEILEEESKETFPNFHLLEFEIGDKKYEFDISPLVSISNSELSFLSSEEMEKSLEKTSSYRFSIMHLKELVDEKLNEFKEDFDRWLSQNWEEAIKEAILRRKRLKDDQAVPNNWFSSLTKEETKGIIASSEKTKEEYLNFSIKIRKYSSALKKLDNLLKILEDRGGHIQSIMRNRPQKKF